MINFLILNGANILRAFEDIVENCKVERRSQQTLIVFFVD